MKTSGLWILLLILGITACSYKEDTGTSQSRDVLTAEEIQQVPVNNAYELVRRLRPNWLRIRSARTASNPSARRPVVYVDGVQAGRAGVLRTIRAEDIVRIRYLDPNDATNRFGTDHSGGAILVTTG